MIHPRIRAYKEKSGAFNPGLTGLEAQAVTCGEEVRVRAQRKNRFVQNWKVKKGTLYMIGCGVGDK